MKLFIAIVILVFKSIKDHGWFTLDGPCKAKENMFDYNLQCNDRKYVSELSEGESTYIFYLMRGYLK